MLAAWALTVAAAFAVGRSTTPSGNDPVIEPLAAAIEAALGEPDLLERAGQTVRLRFHFDTRYCGTGCIQVSEFNRFVRNSAWFDLPGPTRDEWFTVSAFPGMALVSTQ